MLEQKFLDRFDMERRIQSRLYCFGSGASDDDGGGGTQAGDDNVARSNPNEMRAREQEVVRQEIARGTFDDEDDFIQQVNAGNFGATQELERQAAVRQAMGQLPPAPLVSSGGISLGQTQGTVRNLGNIGATPIVDVAASDTVNMPGSYGRIDTTGNPATKVLGFDYAPSSASPSASPDIVDFFDISQVPPAPVTVMGMEDEYDPFAGTGRTAMDVLNYDMDDQSGPAGRIRPFAGLTREQQANLEGRDDFVARQILDAQTAQPSGIPTTNLTGIYTEGNDPMGNVRGFTDFGPELPFIGPTQVYTGFGDNPFAPPTMQDDGETTPPVTNPLTGRSQCPDGYVFDEDLQACRRKNKRELKAGNGTGGGSSRPAGDMFFRRTSLDDAPANLPSGFDFDAANRAFTQSFAVRPSFFQRPPDLTGFTLL